MQTTKEMLDPIKTRGDFRRATESKQPLPSGTLDSLWLALSEAYGSAFVTQYGETPSATWVHGLTGFSEIEIRRGFDAALRTGSEWTPNLAQFLGLIEQSRPQAYHKPFDPNVAIVDKGVDRLENKRPPMTKEEAMAEMRATLGI